VRIELVFGKNSFSYVGFPSRRQALFVPNRPIQLIGQNTYIALERNPFVIEPKHPENCFPVRTE
jgi:hypothetical protein